MLVLMQPPGLTAFAGADINDHDILPHVLLYLHLHTLARGEAEKCKAI